MHVQYFLQVQVNPAASVVQGASHQSAVRKFSDGHTTQVSIKWLKGWGLADYAAT